MSLSSNYEVEGQLSIFDYSDLATWSGKTYPAHLVRENQGAGTLDAYLKKFAELRIKPPQYLNLRGGWSTSGCIMGQGEFGVYSVAWRVHDAQFWGVPQRRKRISLVADFGGDTAPKILFESESVSGDFEQSGETGETTPASPTGCPSETGAYTLKVRGGVEVDRYGKKAGKGALVQTELSATLGVSQDQTLIHTIGHDMRGGKFTDDEITDPLTATDYKDPIKVVHPARGGITMRTNTTATGRVTRATAMRKAIPCIPSTP